MLKRLKNQARSHPLWTQYAPPLGQFYRNLVPWLDTLALFCWGVLFLKYYLTRQLQLLIHPNYFLLVFTAGLLLIALAGLNAWQQIAQMRGTMPPLTEADTQHLTLFPPGVGTGLLLIVAIAGLTIPPKILASDTALQRGLTESLPYTRTQTQSFYSAIQPEDRSLLDWVRTLNAYPEPDAYTGQAVNVKGFVVHPPNLSEDYVLLSRFVITCCAVDAYPVGLPVQLLPNSERYEQDVWLEVKGTMATAVINDNRQLMIKATSIEKIPTPADPYEF